jgi:hypothetical protein
MYIPLTNLFLVQTDFLSTGPEHNNYYCYCYFTKNVEEFIKQTASRDTALDLHSGDATFEYRSGIRLSRMRLFVVSFSPYREMFEWRL